ncbi:MAG: hemin uptake protein HemP [Rhodovibrionaceae bacterium]
MNSRQRYSGPQSDLPSCVEQGSSTTSSGELTVSSQSVMSGRAEIRIDHNGEVYRLRITNSGKLILTK